MCSPTKLRYQTEEDSFHKLAVQTFKRMKAFADAASTMKEEVTKLRAGLRSAEEREKEAKAELVECEAQCESRLQRWSDLVDAEVLLREQKDELEMEKEALLAKLSQEETNHQVTREKLDGCKKRMREIIDEE